MFFKPRIYESLQQVLAEEKLERDAHKAVSTAEATEGILKPVASKILMKILWAARLARPDLLRVISGLATKVCKWTTKEDKALYRVICYIESSMEFQLTGWVGDPLADVSPHLYADADFAGSSSQKSTSGVWSVIRGKQTSFPISWTSKRQTSVSHSTPESEIMAI